ncbi:MAG: sugar porter family MFS transporter [Xanthomonadales bacterium]|nr:sugar porter family MFS transporter [Xanthomonadales bacterium]
MKKGHTSELYVAAVISIGGFLFGFDASVISGVVGFIVPQFGLNDWQVGLVVSAPTLAGIIASWSGAWIADVIGRRRALLVLALLYTVSAVASAFAPNYQTLVFARFVGGLAFASLGIAPMYIGEIAPREKRGMLISVSQLNIVLGFSLAYFANYFVLHISQSDAVWVQTLGIDQNAWRWMLGIEAIPATLWLLFLLTIPESPRWLVMTNRLEEARKSLARLKPPERVERDLAEIARSLSNVQEKFLQRMREVVLPAMRLPMMIGVIAAIAQQVSGINAIFFYAPTIFEQTGVGTNAAFAQAALIGMINVVFTIIAMFLIDRIGRKPLLMVGMVGVILCTAIAGYGFRQASYEITPEVARTLSSEISLQTLQPVVGIKFTNDLDFKNALRETLGDQGMREHEAKLTQAAININSTLILIGILGFVAAFAISLGPVYWCLLSEIFPNRARGPAMAIVGFFNAMTSFLVQFVFPWELSNLGSATMFFIYSGLGVVGLILLAWLLPETKGKSLEELELVLSRT